MKIDIIIGTRPNIVKAAALLREIKIKNKKKLYFEVRVIHTGQHYDNKLSKDILEELEIGEPDILFTLEPGSINEITASIIKEYNKVLLESKPDICLVFGDVTSTMACAIAAKRFNVKIAHVEAGLRSFDNSMPEEINRLITDSISDILLATSEYAVQNLKLNYNGFGNIFLVGNIMIDTLIHFRSKIDSSSVIQDLKINGKKYIILTLHRPSNVDDKIKLNQILKGICDAVPEVKIVFPVHPRTRKILGNSEYISKNLIIIEPLSYINFIKLLKESIGIVTDSGGITEEATYLKIPCVTVRENTERPETITIGSNVLVSWNENLEEVKMYLGKMLRNDWKTSNIPELWDGNTSSRILDLLVLNYKN